MGRRLSQYDVARKQVSQRENAQVQQDNEAINRRFAQSGGGPGGAAIKVQQQTNDASAQRREGAIQQVDAAERAELERRDEVKAGRDFQTSERLGSQGFAGEQSALQRRFAMEEAGKGRDWQTGERLGSQDFAGQQAQKGRDLDIWKFEEGREMTEAQMKQQQAQFDRQGELDIWKTEEGFDQQKKLLGIQQLFQSGQFGQQMDLSWAQLAQQKIVDAANLDLANKVLNEKDFLEKLLAPFQGKDGQFGGALGDLFRSAPSYNGPKFY